MIALLVHDTKEFMNLLLKQNRFDDFYMKQIDITTFTLFQIDGKRNKQYYSLAEQELITDNYCFWKEIRPYAFQIIKGQKLPKSIKIVFSLPKNKTDVISNVPATFFLNVIFEQNTLMCTTGYALETFSMDKTAEFDWDNWVIAFFHELKIAVTKQ